MKQRTPTACYSQNIVSNDIIQSWIKMEIDCFVT